MKSIIKIMILYIGLWSSAYAQNLANDTIHKPSDDELLASQYYQNKEYDKAAVLFEKLYYKNPNSFYYYNYLDCLIELKEFSDAEKIIKKRIKKESLALKYRVDLGYVFAISQQKVKADKEFENALKELNGDNQQTIDLANAFLLRNMPDYAIKTYIKSRDLNKSDNIFNIELAEIYEKLTDYQNMFEEYINLIDSDVSKLDLIEDRLLVTLNNDPDNRKNEIFRKTLLKRIQLRPDKTVYSELMLWHAIQQKDFESALQQAKTLDRLYKENGDRIYNLARLCVSNKEYDVAKDAFDYLIKKGSGNVFYVSSSIEILNVSYLKLIGSFNHQKQDIIYLENDYISTIAKFGKNSSTIALIRTLAHIQAFYLNKIDEGQKLLNEAILLPQISREERASCKTELADILLMSGDVWESTLLYSQVEKEFKYDTIGFNAKYKNARLFYYIGEFNWAKAQLDVLKAATSKLIANDAMDLYLLINDIVDPDDSTGTSEIPLKIYSRADFLTFQNKDDLALQAIDSVFSFCNVSEICDRAMYMKADIKIRKGLYNEADSLLGTIVDKYSSGIIADDALFKKAELNQYQFKNKTKAMELYEKLLKDFPGSLYTVEARKRFRQLRGDQIN